MARSRGRRRANDSSEPSTSTSRESSSLKSDSAISSTDHSRTCSPHPDPDPDSAKRRFLTDHDHHISSKGKKPTSTNEETDQADDYEELNEGGAELPSLRPGLPTDDYVDDHCELLWTAPEKFIVNEEDQRILDTYLETACAKWDVLGDRAMFKLMQNNYNYDRALQALAKSRVPKNPFTTEEHNLFKNAFLVFGDRFGKIAEVFPRRTCTEIVHHYWSTDIALIMENNNIDDIICYARRTFCPVDMEDHTESDDHGELTMCDNCQSTKERCLIIDGEHWCGSCRNYRRVLSYFLCDDPGFRAPWMKQCEELMEMWQPYGPLAQPEVKALVDEGNKDDDGEIEIIASFSRPIDRILAQKRLPTRAGIMAIEMRKETNARRDSLKLRRAQLRILTRTLLSQPKKMTKKEVISSKTRTSREWTENEKKMVFYGFVHYGTEDFNLTASTLKGSKSAEQVKAYYKKHKVVLEKAIKQLLRKVEEE